MQEQDVARGDVQMQTEAQAHLAALSETAAPQFSVDARSFTIVTFNAAASSRFRQTYGIALRRGMRVDDFMVPEAAAYWRGLFTRALQEGPYRVEHVAADGKMLLLVLQPLKRDGAVLGVSVTG